ncbi:MAG: tRNA (cytidine(34)-2'-O)-methyltransferase [Bacillales bacterium]
MLGIILYRPEKPANVGNIMRSCVATNTKLIIIGPLTFKLDDSSLKRAGMDYINELDFKIYENYETFIRYFKDKKIYYLTRYSKNIYSKADFQNISDEIYIMFGRESSGIPHEILKENYEYTLRIPMAPCARSLNLSNCVAIMIYEVLRQQNFFNLATSEIIKGEDFLN